MLSTNVDLSSISHVLLCNADLISYRKMLCELILSTKVSGQIKKLQYWLRHTDTQTTLNIYAHFNCQRLNTSENDLSEISLVSADIFI